MVAEKKRLSLEAITRLPPVIGSEREERIRQHETDSIWYGKLRVKHQRRCVDHVCESRLKKLGGRVTVEKDA